uniref:Uncharacterized protein n=1 Tax=OCS116 cluster bacterium TaxID=2030921 RepID=A0A2A4YU20_9PROT
MHKKLLLFTRCLTLLCSMATYSQAIGCVPVGQLQTILDTTKILPDSLFLVSPGSRKEYERVVEDIVLYIKCVDQKFVKIASEIASARKEKNNRTQLIFEYEEKFVGLESKYFQLKKEIEKSETEFDKLVTRLKYAQKTQLANLARVNDELISKFTEKLIEFENTDANLNQRFQNQENDNNEFVDEVKSSINTIAKSVEELVFDQKTQIKNLENVDRQLELKFEEKVLGLRSSDDIFDKKLQEQGKDFIQFKKEVESSEKEITNLVASLKMDSNNQIDEGLLKTNTNIRDISFYFIIFMLVLILFFIYLFVFLKSRISMQRMSTNAALEIIKRNIEEGSTRIDNKLLGVIETQLKIENTKEFSTAEVDHTLALKVANEIVRIQKNISLMDSNTRGLKQLIASINRLQSNFSASGYEIIEMLNQPYDEGMKLSARFILDENLGKDEQIITRIIKPQVNYAAVMIQAAQIEVSIGE